MLRKQKITNKTFNRYCDRIRSRDGRGLMVLIGEKQRLPDYLYCGNNPIGVLAREGEDAALDWLRLEFCEQFRMRLDFSYAAFMYAQQGREDRFQPLMELSVECRWMVLRGLAFGGHHEWVNKYVDETSEGDRNSVLYGYAAVDNDEYVKEWQRRGGDNFFRIKGYAFGGHVEEVNNFLAQAQGRSWEWILYNEYARGGWIENLEVALLAGLPLTRIAVDHSRLDVASIYARYGYMTKAHRHLCIHTRNSLICQYAAAGYLDKVNQRIEKGCDVRNALQIYEENGDMTYQDRVRHILVFLDDEQLQNDLLAFNNMLHDLDVILPEVRSVQQVMQRYNMDYYSAFTMRPDQRNELLEHGEAIAVWLLQVQQGLFSRGVNYDVLCHISAYVLGVDDIVAHRVLNHVAEKIFTNTKKQLDYTYRDSWHAWFMGKRLRYDSIHASKTYALEEIGIRNQMK